MLESLFSCRVGEVRLTVLFILKILIDAEILFEPLTYKCGVYLYLQIKHG